MSPVDASSGSARRPADGDRPVLRATGLRKSFSGVEVLRGIDLEIRRGEVIALIGPSGSGKTTVLRSLNSLEVPDGGVLELADGSVLDFGGTVGKRALTALRDRSAMVFQHFNLFPHLTVLQNVTEGPLRVQRRPQSEVVPEAEALLERVGLGGRGGAYPFELSGGQQQRVGIVRALALRPDLLLFDEPTSALDPELVGDVLSLMRELAGEGWTMLVVTHELEFARQVASEVVFMADGVVVERGAPAQILREPQEPRTQQFLHRLLHPLE